MQEFNLKTYIANLCDNGTFTREYLSQFAGYKKSSGFIKWLNNDEAEITNFKDLISLLKKIAPNNTSEFMAKYSMNISPTHSTAKMMLEYLSCSRELESMEQLIIKMESSTSKTAKEWAKVYRLQHEWQNKYGNPEIDDQLDVNAHLKSVKDINTEDETLKILLMIMQCYCYYENENYKMALEYSEELILDIANLKDGYIKESYNTKVNEVLAYINLFVLNNPEASRKNSYEILEADTGRTLDVHGYAYYFIGYSYFYTNFSEAEKFLLKSYNIYIEIGKEAAASSVLSDYQKLKIFWRKKISTNEFLSKKNELYYGMVNNNDLKDLLLVADSEVKKGTLRKGELEFFKGKQENNKDIMTVGMIELIKEGNTFESLFLYFELIKMGASEIVLNSLIGFHSL